MKLEGNWKCPECEEENGCIVEEEFFKINQTCVGCGNEFSLCGHIAVNVEEIKNTTCPHCGGKVEV